MTIPLTTIVAALFPTTTRDGRAVAIGVIAGASATAAGFTMTMLSIIAGVSPGPRLAAVIRRGGRRMILSLAKAVAMLVVSVAILACAILLDRAPKSYVAQVIAVGGCLLVFCQLLRVLWTGYLLIALMVDEAGAPAT
jgi:hypothetical protein